MTEKKSSTNSQEDVLQFLEDLDTYSTNPSTIETRTEDDVQSVLDYVDQIVQTSTTNTSVKQGSEQKLQKDEASGSDDNNSGAWSWGNILASASTAYKTASTVVDSSVKGALATVETVRANEATKKLEEKVRSDLKSLSLNTLTTVVNAVVPPISQYEIVEVWLAHDMIGYIGLESIVYRGFIKVMEQVEGGDIIVKKGNNNETKKVNITDELYRDLNVCEGFVEAIKLAKANIEQTIKKHYDPISLEKERLKTKESQQRETPSIICPVFMSIQPTKANPYVIPTLSSSTPSTDNVSENFLFFVIVLTDPTHNLTFETYSQALPISWLDVKYEENEWVEDKMVASIKLAVQTIAQDYVWHLVEGKGEVKL
ncbi:10853_t:CDS:2 [Entrophospora sp. SA101]|nr:10853_t:CDS:2 [Entrophospora sp. SA101]